MVCVCVYLMLTRGRGLFKAKFVRLKRLITFHHDDTLGFQCSQQYTVQSTMYKSTPFHVSKFKQNLTNTFCLNLQHFIN